MCSFFENLENIAAKVDSEVDLIKQSLERPKSSFPSQTAASKMKETENQVKDVLKQSQSLYKELTQNLEECTQIKQSLQGSLSEMEQNANLIEHHLSLSRLGYKTWQEVGLARNDEHPTSQSKPLPDPFLSPNVNTYQQPDSSPIPTVSPILQISISSSSVVSYCSTPMFQTSGSGMRHIRPTEFSNYFSNGGGITHSTATKPITCTGNRQPSPTSTFFKNSTPTFEPKVRPRGNSTPEEPILISECYLKEKNGKNTTPEEPILVSCQYPISGMPSRSTPEEPVLLTGKRLAKCNNTSPCTPEEPILSSVTLAIMNSRTGRYGD